MLDDKIHKERPLYVLTQCVFEHFVSTKYSFFRFFFLVGWLFFKWIGVTDRMCKRYCKTKKQIKEDFTKVTVEQRLEGDREEIYAVLSERTFQAEMGALRWESARYGIFKA